MSLILSPCDHKCPGRRGAENHTCIRKPMVKRIVAGRHFLPNGNLILGSWILSNKEKKIKKPKAGCSEEINNRKGR